MANFIDSLAVIIVVYNTNLEASQSFKAVKGMPRKGESLELIVYDNSKKPQQPIEHPGLRITYFHDPDNPGVSKAYNVAAAHAMANRKEWILLLDQDTTMPATLLGSYTTAIGRHPEIKLFVPILKLQNGKIFSPCSYRFKRGFYLTSLVSGIHSLNKLAPVNSGMLIDLKAFHKVGGYNEKVKLDFSDFQFIERFRSVYSTFYVMDVVCEQDFSDDDISFTSQAKRFRYYCEGAGNIEKDGAWDWIQYNTFVLLRAMRLTIRYGKGGFLGTYISTFLFRSNSRS
jgi:GT2 family glycosyltransferase